MLQSTCESGQHCADVIAVQDTALKHLGSTNDGSGPFAQCGSSYLFVTVALTSTFQTTEKIKTCGFCSPPTLPRMVSNSA